MPAVPTLVGWECDCRIPAVPASDAATASAETIKIFMRNLDPVEADENFAVV